jgi:transcriptional regulator with XRE-family HTH domain
MTQMEFCDALGISQSHLSNLERGFAPSMKVLMAIAGVRVYDGEANLNWLLTGKGAPAIGDEADWQLAQQIQALDNEK